MAPSAARSKVLERWMGGETAPVAASTAWPACTARVSIRMASILLRVNGEDGRRRGPLVDRELEHVGPGVMAGDVEIEPAARDLAHVQVSHHDVLAVVERSGQQRPQWGDDGAAAAAHDLRLAGQVLGSNQVRR